MFIRLLSFFLCSGLAFTATGPSFPALTYSTYLRDNFTPAAIATDSSGNIYMAGNAIVDPATMQTTVLVVKLNPQGSEYLYTRYVGGSISDGASAIAVDSAGNAYVAGSTNSPDFPNTGGSPGTPPPGVIERSFVFKLDPSGQLVFSELLGTSTDSFALAVAVNAAGQVLVSGVSASPGFPSTPGAYSVANTDGEPYLLELDAPEGPAAVMLSTPALPFLSKLDPNGQKLLFSVPVGGAGVQVDANGSAYVGGIFGTYDLYNTEASIPALANVPAPCLPTYVRSAAYVAQVDAGSGNLLGSQFLGVSPLPISGVALHGSTFWISATTYFSNFPFSVKALTTGSPGPDPVAGAFLGAVDFSRPQPRAGTPQIACIVDAANLQPAGPVVPNQLLTIYGTGLGPATPVSAKNNSTTTLGGVNVSFGSLAAPLLYVSPNQINLAVPLIPEGPLSAPAMQVVVNGIWSAPLEFLVTSANPSVFVVPGGYSTTTQGFAAAALNADGSQNSPTNPAHLGSVISVFVNGLARDPAIPFEPPDLYTAGGWSVTSSSQTNPFVLEVGLQVPSSSANLPCQSDVCRAFFELYDLNSYLSVSQPGIQSGLRFGGEVYVTQAQ